MYYSYIITMRSRSARSKWGPLVQLLIIYAAGWTDRQTYKRAGGGGLKAERFGVSDQAACAAQRLTQKGYFK